MPPKPDDSVLWRRAMRGVVPMAPRPTPLSPPAPAAKREERHRASRAATRPGKEAPPLTVDRFAGIDRANAERLKRGQHRIEARLDLHGLTQAEAHRALSLFIGAGRASGKRCVLVITGRGVAGGGVLRAAVPRWLDEPEFRSAILAITTAQPRDGGAGALYVMLRRGRAG